MGKSTRRNFIKTSSSLLLPILLKNEPLLAQDSNTSHVSVSKFNINLENTALSRLSFGPNSADREHFRKLGKNQQEQFLHYIEEQLHPESIVDHECENRLQKMEFTTLHKSLEQLWKDHVVALETKKEEAKKQGKNPVAATNNTALNDQNKKDENKLRQLPTQETELATWIKAVYSRKQLNELYVDFWHNHFNVFAWDGKIASVFSHYDQEIIRKHAFGNFRELLEANAKSPAMLLYLDNALNQSGNPNENYARELFELHTLGAENYLGTMDRKKVPGYAKGAPQGYVDGDVYEAARCFTGWRIEQGPKTKDTGNFDYYDPWHDRFQKIVLGHSLKEYQPPLKDGHDILDILAKHPGTAHYIAQKICRRFVSDHASEELIVKVAKVFHDSQNDKDQLRKTLRAAIASDEFKTSFGQKIKRPFEYIAGIIRSSEAEFMPSDDFLHNYERTGQKLFAWRSPDGHPDLHEKWLSPNSLIERWRLANQILSGQCKGIRIPKLELNNKKVSFLDFLSEWEMQALPMKLSEKSRNEILKICGTEANEMELRSGIALLYLSPEAQWR